MKLYKVEGVVEGQRVFDYIQAETKQEAKRRFKMDYTVDEGSLIEITEEAVFEKPTNDKKQ